MPYCRIFNECVSPLIDALFHGYNGTILAYGQTGSGKTYTLGTNCNGEENSGSIIPRVMETMFSKVESMKDSIDFLVRVSFTEIFNEEIFDLLDATPSSRVPRQISETINGGITLAGVMEAETSEYSTLVRSGEEIPKELNRVLGASLVVLAHRIQCAIQKPVNAELLEGIAFVHTIACPTNTEIG
ncbi:hypothetical protein Dimus_026734 [Dionaea muscipula]